MRKFCISGDYRGSSNWSADSRGGRGGRGFQRGGRGFDRGGGRGWGGGQSSTERQYTPYGQKGQGAFNQSQDHEDMR